ncbi:FAD-dependent oxidoreductase [Pseudonocardia phyllosphaerae]|uniref:FAD-dependent oxidoreductase n=1 Tax=Pseudonocardia phyllosphaerae TaxID=3390502 RepID=UPI00397B8231
MRVVIAGGGIGGLALAQGLERAGIGTVVLERDARPEDTGGYRLNLDADARTALSRLLPPQVFQAVLGSAAAGTDVDRFTFCNHRMRVLAETPLPPAHRVMIGRVALRTLLATGLDVRWGAAYRSHTIEPGGSVLVRHDAGTETADVLVGADGTRSAVARSLAGRTLSAPTGVDGVAGTVPLDDTARDLLPCVLDHGSALAFGPRGAGMFLTVHDPSTSPVNPSACTSPAAIRGAASVLIGVHVPADRLPSGAGRLDGPGLLALLGRLLREWDPALRTLVDRIDPATLTHFRLQAADPDADPAPWPSGVVTAIGDAVHAMPPTGGRGAATAIRDADVLTGRLVAARDGRTTIPLALHAYEREMATYGPEAVRVSLEPLARQRRMSGPLGGALLRAAGLGATLRTARSRTARPARTPHGGTRPAPAS